AHDLRRHMFQQLRMFLKREHVADIDPDQAAGTFTTRLFTRAAISNDENVLAEFAQDSVVTALKTLTHCGENDNGDHAPRDAKHREETPDFVRLQILPDLRQDDHCCGFSRSGNVRIVSTLYFL